MPCSQLRLSARLTRTGFVLGLCVVSIFLLISDPSHAGRYKLKCDGPYQIVQGQPISTPHCADAYLAAVARSYRIQVTNKQVQNNIHKKIEICNFIGHDTRISHLCDGYRQRIK